MRFDRLYSSPEVLHDWEEERTEWFGPERWKVVRKLLTSPKMFGICYYDAKPGNIEFGDAGSAK